MTDLGEGRFRTSMLPWMREFERMVLLPGVAVVVDDEDRRWLLTVEVVLFS